MEIDKIDAQILGQLAELSGLDLPLDRAAALVAGLQEILEVDARLASLDLGTSTIVGVPWNSEVDPDNKL